MIGSRGNMADWREQILKEFTPGVARLTLVADPDSLLLEETLLAAIRHRGFELISFEDNATFRFAYETGFRSRWDRGAASDLEVAVRVDSHDLETLPYDILKAGRPLAFSLGALFPDLSYPVVATLDRSDLDALHDAQQRHRPGQARRRRDKGFRAASRLRHRARPRQAFSRVAARPVAATLPAAARTARSR